MILNFSCRKRAKLKPFKLNVKKNYCIYLFDLVALLRNYIFSFDINRFLATKLHVLKTT